MNHNIISVFVKDGLVHHIEMSPSRDMAVRAVRSEAATTEFDDAAVFDVAQDTTNGNTQIARIFNLHD